MTTYRSVLEALKFLSVQEALVAGSLVCKQWQKAAESDELWSLYAFAHALYLLPDKPLRRCFTESLSRRKTVAVAREDRVGLFQCVTRTSSWQVLSDSIHLGVWRAAVLPDSSVFISTDQDESANCAYWITGCTVTAVQPTLQTRIYESLVVFEDTLFSFGGVDPEYTMLRSAEKQSLFPLSDFPSRKWTKEPDMQSKRMDFGACVYKRLIYLSGGQDMEIYSPDLRNYTVTRMRMNIELISLITVKGDTCILISDTRNLEIDLRSTTIAAMKETKHCLMPTGNAVYAGKCVYWAEEKGVVMFSIRTERIKREIALSG